MRRQLNRLGREMKPALSRALNSTATRARNEVAKTMRADIGPGLNSAAFKKSVRVIKSTSRTLRAVIRGEGGALPLIRFQARQTKRGVTAKAWGRKRLYPGTFISKGKRSNSKAVFKLKGGQRGERSTVKRGKHAGKTYRVEYPIEELFGPGIAQLFSDRDIWREIKAQVKRHWPSIIEREIEFRLRRLSASAGVS